MGTNDEDLIRILVSRSEVITIRYLLNRLNKVNLN